MYLDQLKPEEDISRYILNKSCFSSQNRRVKYSAFLPASNGETSVFRITGLLDYEIWEIGHREVAQKRGKPLLGRADISALHVLEEGLRMKPDNNPPRHANIIGWPEEKSGQKLIAMELAANAQLHLVPGER